MGVEALIDQLETRIRDARKTPLIGGVRIDRWEVYDLVAELRAELAKLVRPLDEDRVVRRGAGVWGPMEELFETVVGAGNGDRVRVDRDRLMDLVGRMREGVGQEEIVARPVPGTHDPAALLALVERLETLAAEAHEIPLVPDEVRMETAEIYAVIAEMRAALPLADTRLIHLLPVLDELDQSVRNARPVPLTDQVRINRAKLSTTLKRIRAAFSQGTLALLTN
jgi:hypothetical protein